MSSSIYYINGKQQYNSDVSFNNTNTQITSLNSVLIDSADIRLNGYTTINGSAPITLNTDNVWTGKNYFPMDASFGKLFISSSATAPTLTDKILSVDETNHVVYVDLSLSSSTSVALGGHSLMNNKIANNSTAIGYDSMKNVSNNQQITYNNTALGNSSMLGNDLLNIIGTNNTSIGSNSMENIIDGSGNVAVGSQSLKSVTSGSNNTVIGSYSDISGGNLSNNQIIGTLNKSYHNNVNIIGNEVVSDGSNRTFINNIRNTTGHEATNISIYNPLTNELSYCNDMIQKNINNQQFISQQGIKLVAIDSFGQSLQGSSLALSKDGNTLAVGGDGDNGGVGAVWIWTKDNYTWTKKDRLITSNYLGSYPVNQGCSVAFSDDGNTIAIGGPGDNNGVGAVWIWTRQDISSSYVYQEKIVGTGSSGLSNMGSSVALSGDGNVLVFGGLNDNNNKGAVWIWTRNEFGSNYSQYQTKITGLDSTINSHFGKSVCISRDGSTIGIGAYRDNNYVGAAFVYTKVISTWTQQGSKLIGTSNSQSSMSQGYSIAISNDGNTLAFGGISDNNNVGAAWVFTRNGNVWTQVNKLIGLNHFGSIIYQGSSISMTDDGNTIVVGGNNDNNTNGAVWVFNRNSFGELYFQQGDKIVGSGNVTYGAIASKQGSSVLISSDGHNLFVGGTNDNNLIGAVWAYKRTSNNIYIGNENTNITIGTTTPNSQLIAQIIQSEKLVALDNCGNSLQGYSVAITNDGYTMAIGSPGDDNNKGCVWIWYKIGDTWNKHQKIVGSVDSFFGCSVAFSGSLDNNGNTLAIGSYGDNYRGSAWIFTRQSFMSNYTLQGTKILPYDLSGNNNQFGYSVALSSDGNRLVVGSPGDNDDRGATRVWDRTGSTWTQLGLRMYGTTSSTSSTKQGYSVALSGDGYTLVIGGIGDDNGNGAVWVFVWSTETATWSLLQTKLIDNTNTSGSNQGYSVSISNDGNTLMYGSPSDNNGYGSSTIWKRNVVFTKIQKITVSDNIGYSNLGSSVAISGDGLTIINGGKYDNNIGAVWIFNRKSSENIFYQFGPKIVGSGNIGNSQQGYSVSITSDGSNMCVGGNIDNPSSQSLGVGAVWVFKKNSSNISINEHNQFIGIGKVTPTAALTISCKNSNQGVSTGSSCIDIYNYDIGGAFQRYFSNNQSNAWWHVGSEVGDGGQNFPFHVINHNGTGLYVNSGDQSWSGYSDKRLKTNIKDIDISGAYQNILKLNPVTYKLITNVNDKQLKQGLIAQDVLEIFPQIVSMNNGLYGIGYTELIPYLIAGMKQQSLILLEQEKNNMDLKNEIDELKRKNNAFEERLAKMEERLV